MLSDPRILVIARHDDLRRSLSFALQAEGYVVTARFDLPPRPTARDYDAIVVDETSLGATREDIVAFCRRASPIVLIASDTRHWLAPEVFCRVPSPLRTGTLTGALAMAVAARDRVSPK